MSTNEYRVTGMTCGHCESAVRAEVAAVEGVDAVEVTLETGKLLVTGSDTVADAAVIAAVEEAGYDAVRVP